MTIALTYKQAKPHIKKVEKLLRSMTNLKIYVEETNKEINELKGILNCAGRSSYSFNSRFYAAKMTSDEISEKIDKLIQGVKQTRMTISRLENALNSLDESHQKMMKYIFIDGKNLTDTADEFSYSISSVCRIKKLSLSKMTEQIFGVIIDNTRRFKKTS